MTKWNERKGHSQSGTGPGEFGPDYSDRKQYQLGYGNRDGWWNKYIKNTGPVEYQTLYCRPHWQCIKCDFNDHDIGTVRQHVYKMHDSPIRKDTVGGFHGLDDSMGG